MTAKRFTVDEGLENVLCWEINDKENEDMTCGECAKLLNELAEENEQLKKQREELFIRERDTKNDWRELKQENKQLKHSIKCLEADKMELQQYIKRMQGDVE